MLARGGMKSEGMKTKKKREYLKNGGLNLLLSSTSLVYERGIYESISFKFIVFLNNDMAMCFI